MSTGTLREHIAQKSSKYLLRNLAREKLAQLRQQQAPKPPRIEDCWTPNPGPQAEFFNSTCREVLYGGSAGGGKTSALTALVLRWSHLRAYEAVVLRRETTQLDDLTQKSKELFAQVYPGLQPVHSPNFEWTFPAGGKAKYRHCQREHDYAKFDGWEINLLCFDELTHFTERQYKAICARVRSSKPELPRFIRATTNPGGEGHDWVFKHWGAWLDPEFTAAGLEQRLDASGNKLPPAKPGEVFWISTDNDGNETYFRSPQPLDEHGNEVALSRTFIPAKLEDNPHLLKNDPAYMAQLNALDPVRREQLKGGNWLAKPAAGKYFKREWVEFIDAAPTAVFNRVRAWDFAGTEKTEGDSGNPDWTVGVLMSVTDTQIVVEDVVRFRGNPGEVKRRVKQTAEQDGALVTIRIPQDPGQAGKAQIVDYTLELTGYAVLSKPVTGDKIQRFAPFSSQAELATKGIKRVAVVRGPWNAAYLGELEGFPEAGHKKDQVDATSDGFDTLVSHSPGEPPAQDAGGYERAYW
jgi:predicted phage terminase large subunit-like protein